MNRRSFFGFLAAAPVVPLMMGGNGGTVFHHGSVVDNQTHLIGDRLYDFVMTHSQASRLAKIQFASYASNAQPFEWDAS